MTLEEIRDAIRLSAVADEGITENCYQRVSQLKINKLRKLQVEFSESPDVAVGGLDNLKQWINQRSKLFSEQLSNSKLPSPKVYSKSDRIFGYNQNDVKRSSPYCFVNPRSFPSPSSLIQFTFEKE